MANENIITGYEWNAYGRELSLVVNEENWNKLQNKNSAKSMAVSYLKENISNTDLADKFLTWYANGADNLKDIIKPEFTGKSESELGDIYDKDEAQFLTMIDFDTAIDKLVNDLFSIFDFEDGYGIFVSK